MKKLIYKSYEEPPLLLNVSTVAKALGISLSSGYHLAHKPDFPILHIGSRIVIPKNAFVLWAEDHTGGVQ